MPDTDPTKPTLAPAPRRSLHGQAMRLRQAELLLNVSKTVAAFETLDEFVARLNPGVV